MRKKHKIAKLVRCDGNDIRVYSFHEVPIPSSTKDQETGPIDIPFSPCNHPAGCVEHVQEANPSQ